MRDASGHEGQGGDQADRQIKGKAVEQDHEKDGAPAFFLNAIKSAILLYNTSPRGFAGVDQ